MASLSVAAVIAAAILVTAVLYAWWPAGSLRDKVSVRESLGDYSWDELARIAERIEACDNEEQAVACAARYGLCDSDGSLRDAEAKELTLVDGTTVRVVLVDVWHDERSDGGKAGLTFMMADAVGPHAMNHVGDDPEGEDSDSTGGWAASDMRAWLQDSLWYQLPVELRGHIVGVQKHTACSVDETAELADTGHLAGSAADWVEETGDVLWLPSVVELCGSVPERESMDVDATMSAVYAAEGGQYRLFAQMGVAAFQANEGLVRSMAATGESCTWWLRSKTLEFGDGFWLVGTDGCPLNALGEDVRVVEDPEFAPDELWGTDHPRGVVVGFCL
jgi:hypothetical protein